MTIMVDLTRDQDGCLRARLLDAVVGRSAPPTGPGGKPSLTGSPGRLNRPLSTRFAAMPTPFATRCPTRSRP